MILDKKMFFDREIPRKSEYDRKKIPRNGNNHCNAKQRSDPTSTNAIKEETVLLRPPGPDDTEFTQAKRHLQPLLGPGVGMFVLPWSLLHVPVACLQSCWRHHISSYLLPWLVWCACRQGGVTFIVSGPDLACCILAWVPWLDPTTFMDGHNNENSVTVS